LIDPITTNTAAIAFYRRLGFTFLENRRFGQDDCAVHQLTRQNWNKGPNP
jgi:aminoglycoside 6'-N-acetyltransferase